MKASPVSAQKQKTSRMRSSRSLGICRLSSRSSSAFVSGTLTFVCPLPGWWAFSTSMAGDPLQDPEGKQKPLEIKTIFWVYMNDCPKTAPSKK